MGKWKDSAPDNQSNDNEFELGNLLNEVNHILDFSLKKEKEVILNQIVFVLDSGFCLPHCFVAKFLMR